MVAGTPSEITYDIADAAGNTYTFNFPRVKFNNPNVNASGNSQDVMASLTFQALIDSSEATDLKITRNPASP